MSFHIPGNERSSVSHLALEGAWQESKALADRDAAGALLADEAFHHVWVEAAGNRVLAEVLRPLKLKLRRVELAYFRHGVRGERSLGEHTAMLDALRAGQWDRAAARLRQNWRASLERLVAQQGLE